MIEWLIVGGGVQGSHLARVLRVRMGVPADALRIVDDAPAPLAAWDRRAAACAMGYLRSPQVHHIGLPAPDLRWYADSRGYDRAAFTAPYMRPSTSLFAAHSAAVVADEPSDLRLRDRVEAIESIDGGYRVIGRHGRWCSRRVLLAPGPPPLRRPGWAAGLAHVFDPDFDLSAAARPTVAVVGGGITAAQTALAVARSGCMVDLVTRRFPRLADFDSAPCYAGPKCLGPFMACGWHEKRRRITRARNPGSLPRDVARALRRARREGRIRVHAKAAVWLRDNGLRLEGGGHLVADEIVLATGFARGLPGGDLVRRVVRRFALPLAPCGFPALGDDLQWRAGLFLAGGLAELSLGPTAGNIRGARLAGERLHRQGLLD
ncbi:MAG: NAD(P)-binding domain-containing protein [Salinisphaera sp.]|nr:NAD(P)-binding domain-containing protein [Salinisphaera sp.]